MPTKNNPETIQSRYFLWPIYQRANGYWYADGRSNGAQIRRTSLGSQDRTEAIKNLHKLDQLCAEQLGLAPRSNTGKNQKLLSIKAGRSLYEAHISRPRVAKGTRKSTQKRYRAILDKFVAFLARRRIQSWSLVTEKTLTDYAAELEERGYAYKTIFGELTTLKSMIRWLCEENHIDRSPLKLPLQKAECQRPYCYTTDQVGAMVKICSDNEDLDWLHYVLVALSCTGLRISELAALRWPDINLDDLTLRVADETAYTGEQADRRSTKGGRSRSIPIRKELHAVLKCLPRNGSQVFRGPRGGRLKPDTVRNIFVREVIKPLKGRFPNNFAGDRSFEDGRLHSFRHYFCSVCANSGIPERIAMEWLGHSSSDMVKHYYHLSDDESRKKMDQLNLFGDDDGCSDVGDKRN